MHSFTVLTIRHTELIDLSDRVQQSLKQAGAQNGVCVVFVPHTTAGITINENADPDVATDMVHVLDKLVPWKSPGYRHAEGNTAAHLKASLLGHSAHVPVVDGKLQLGTWQAIYLCEFDGPRSRRVLVQFLGE